MYKGASVGRGVGVGERMTARGVGGMEVGCMYGAGVNVGVAVGMAVGAGVEFIIAWAILVSFF